MNRQREKSELRLREALAVQRATLEAQLDEVMAENKRLVESTIKERRRLAAAAAEYNRRMRELRDDEGAGRATESSAGKATSKYTYQWRGATVERAAARVNPPIPALLPPPGASAGTPSASRVDDGHVAVSSGGYMAGTSSGGRLSASRVDTVAAMATAALALETSPPLPESAWLDESERDEHDVRPSALPDSPAAPSRFLGRASPGQLAMA